MLSVLRSDARALGDHLRQRAGALLAEGFERDLMRVPVSELRARSANLRASGHHLIGIKSALEGIAGSLRLELRRAFQHDLPSPARSRDPSFARMLEATIENLRPRCRTRCCSSARRSA